MILIECDRGGDLMNQLIKQLDRFIGLYLNEYNQFLLEDNCTTYLDIYFKAHVEIAWHVLQIAKSPKMTRKKLRKILTRLEKGLYEPINTLYGEEPESPEFIKYSRAAGMSCALSDIRDHVNRKRYIRKRPLY